MSSEIEYMFRPDSVESVPIGALLPYANNARTHTEAQVAQIAGSMKRFGWTNPCIIDAEGVILAGHGRVSAARLLGLSSVPCIRVPLSGVEARAYILADNRLAELAGWDDEMLKEELTGLVDEGFDISIIGFEGFDFNAEPEAGEGEAGNGRGKLNEKFMVSPFSVLNAREGWWQDRKSAWISIGLRSESGRVVEASKDQIGGVLMNDWHSTSEFYSQKTEVEKRLKVKLSTEDFHKNHFVIPKKTELAVGTSVFDPVLCEVLYRWFSPLDGLVLDPFAGGSVRGVVAAKLGRRYLGVDLRDEQCVENELQWELIAAAEHDAGGQPLPAPEWRCGDSRNIDQIAAGVQADFIFTCPPYVDLEVYSDNPSDLSTMAYKDFLGAYREIIRKSCAQLKEDRFAAIVVGEVRDKRGAYYDFVGDTVQAFRDAGLQYYNEAILVTQVVNAAMRAGAHFTASRKLSKTHQNVLIFVKGSAKKAVAELPDVMVPEVNFFGAGDDDDVSCPNCGHVWALNGGVLLPKE